MIESVIGDYSRLVHAVLRQVDALKIDRADLIELDHLAYRASTSETYKAVCQALQPFGEQISENMISERPIAVYRLNEPILCEGYAIPALEVMAPKPQDTFPDGLEHLEFVIGSSIEEFLAKYPGIDFNTENLGRKTNPVITVKFDGYSVRFHTRDLIGVALLQKETGEI